MSKRAFLAAWLFVFSAASITARSATAGWPDTIDLLTQERSQAEACVTLLKDSGDASAIREGRIAYGVAKAASDGAIAGLTTALVEGGKPENLPRIQADLEKAGAGLQDICDAARKAASGATGTKGGIEDAVTAAVGPVIDALKSAAGALWTRHVESDKLELETIKSQLEAARWPDF